MLIWTKFLMSILFKATGIIVLLFSLYTPANAGTLESQTTIIPYLAVNAKGSDLRGKLDPILEKIKAGNFDSANIELNHLIEQYRAIFDKTLQQRCFLSKESAKQYATNNPDEKFEWIDWGYREALQMQAFIFGDRKEFSKAIAALNELDRIAPFFAGTYIEIGYNHQQNHDPKAALQAYQKAFSIASVDTEQSQLLAPATRGIGSSLIELGELDAAEKIFTQLLEINPDDAISKNELGYIQDLKTKK